MDPQTMDDDSGRFKDFQEQFNNLRSYNNQVRDTVAELKERSQTGTLQSYFDPFQSLLTDGWVDEELAISLFLGGLSMDIRNPVKIFKPRTLNDAHALVWLQESVHSTSLYKPSPPLMAPQETQGESVMNNFPDKEYVDDHDCNSNCDYHGENVLDQIEIGQEREESDGDYHFDVENEGSSQQGQTATPSGERRSSVDEFEAERKEFGVTDCSVHAILLSVPYPSIIPSFPVEKEISSIDCAYNEASFHTVHDIDFEQFVETKHQELHISLARQKISNDYGVIQTQSSKGREASKLWSCKFNASVECIHAELVGNEVERKIDKENGRSSLGDYELLHLGSMHVQTQDLWLFWIEGKLKEEEYDEEEPFLKCWCIINLIWVQGRLKDENKQVVSADEIRQLKNLRMGVFDSNKFSKFLRSGALVKEEQRWQSLEQDSRKTPSSVLEVANGHVKANGLDPNAENNELAFSPRSFTWFDAAKRLLLLAAIKTLFYWYVVRKKRTEISTLLQGNRLFVTWKCDSQALFMELSSLFFDGTSVLLLANFLNKILMTIESGLAEQQLEFSMVNSQLMPSFPLEEPARCLSSLTTLEEDDGLSMKLRTLLVALEDGLIVQFWKSTSPLLPFKWEIEHETKDILDPQIIEPRGQGSLRGKQMILSVDWPFIFFIAASRALAPLGDVAHVVVVMTRKEAWSRRKKKVEEFLNEINSLQKSTAMSQKNFWFVFFLKLCSSLGKYRGFRFKLATSGSRKPGSSRPITMDMKNVEKLIRSAT